MASQLKFTLRDLELISLGLTYIVTRNASDTTKRAADELHNKIRIAMAEAEKKAKPRR